MTGRLALSQGGRASHREAGPLTGRLGLSHRGKASHRRPGLLQGALASHREAWPLTGRVSLSQKGRASHREAEPRTGRQGLSQGGRASHREAGPLTGRLGLTTCQLTTSQLAKKTNKNLYIHKILRYQFTCKLQNFGFCNKTTESFTLSASQNIFVLGTLFPRSSAF